MKTTSYALTITLENNFHNTAIAVRPAECRRGGDTITYFLSPAQCRKVSRNLCGMADCRCGTVRMKGVINFSLDSRLRGYVEMVDESI